MGEYSGMNWVWSKPAAIVAGLCAAIGLAISLYNIIQHIVHYTRSEQQLYIVRILFIVPLYCIVSVISLLFIDFSLYFEIFRDVYEAFVVYCFLILILGYVGGEANCINLISLKPAMRPPFPLCCFPHIPLNVPFLRFCKLSCIQFIIIKPIFAIINVIVLVLGYYHDLLYQVFIKLLYNASYGIALYGLLLFYMACKDDIRAYSPVRKFLSVKIIVFATYWQSLIVSFAPGIDPETIQLWNDFILCCEMSIFATIHLYSFPWWEFRAGIPPNKELLSMNAKKVISFKDVVRDVYHNIAPAYQKYVLQTDDGTIKEYQTKTFMIGNLNSPYVHNKYIPNLSELRERYGVTNSTNDVKITIDIDADSVLLVFGYLREFKSDYNDLDNLILDKIQNECLSFYFIPECFCSVSDKVELSNGDRTISLNSSNNLTCYGSTKIRSTDQSIYIWKFRVNVIDENTVIGIEEIPGMSVENDFYRSIDRVNYGYASNGAKWSQNKQEKYGAEYKSDDVVEMILDLVLGELYYSVNGEDKGICYQIKRNEQLMYLMAVAFCNKTTLHNQITLIEFTTK